MSEEVLDCVLKRVKLILNPKSFLVIHHTQLIFYRSNEGNVSK